MKRLSVSIIGAGRLGSALAIALSKKRYPVKQIFVRNELKFPQIKSLIKSKPEILSVDKVQKISADIIFITTQDSEIEASAAHLASNINYKPIIFHTSGSKSSDSLKKLSEKGCLTASFHPAAAISDPEMGAKIFKGTYFCLEGNSVAVAHGREIVKDLEGVSFTINTENKILYHAAAVMASGHIVSVFSAAVEMLAKCGLSENEAQQTFLPLIKSALENLTKQTPSEALTGTFARADIETMQNHLDSMQKNGLKDIADIYSIIGLRAIKLAESQGANASKLAKMKSILQKEESKNSNP